MKSIAHRIYKAIFIISLVCIVLIISTVLIVNENLEDTMLQGANKDLIFPTSMEKNLIAQNTPFIWDSTLNKVAYLPKNSEIPANFPAVFLLINPLDHAELELDGSTYLINVERYDKGDFYWARNIDAFEKREGKLQIAVLLIALLISTLSFLLALYSSRKIVQPLKNLTQQINNLPIDQEFGALDMNFQDLELNEIAKTFNFFLSELESHIQREKKLLNLASHELRTPIAVIAGALDVIEARQQLHSNDAHTLQRIRRANAEMGNNVTILLQLARGTLQNTAVSPIDLTVCIEDVVTDLAETYPAQERIKLTGQKQLISHPALVKMLLRNVIQNALQHTTGLVHIGIDAEKISIQDEGSATTNNTAWTTPHISNQGGLGLYLVTLMCEQLGWGLEITPTPQAGTQITLRYSQPHIS